VLHRGIVLTIFVLVGHAFVSFCFWSWSTSTEEPF
jgi:hypothetical protein